MKRSQIISTLTKTKMAMDNTARCTHLLLGIYQLLVAIAEDMDILEKDENEAA